MWWTDRPTDGPTRQGVVACSRLKMWQMHRRTDLPTDTARCRVACLRLKKFLLWYVSNNWNFFVIHKKREIIFWGSKSILHYEMNLLTSSLRRIFNSDQVKAQWESLQILLTCVVSAGSNANPLLNLFTQHWILNMLLTFSRSFGPLPVLDCLDHALHRRLCQGWI